MRSTFLIFLIIITGMCAPFLLAQETQIYKTTHKDGMVTYSDQPSPGAVELNLTVNTNTIQSTPTPKVVVRPLVTQKKRDYQVSIISPENDASIRSNIGTVKITSALEPTLAGIYQLSIDGQIIDSASGVFVLENMNRGSYQYQVKFIGNTGKVIALSETRSLHLHRASVLIN